ncbi:hypothetical protein GEV33_011246 [Tenebrio molitor]|uniref:Retroviral polymerase SH3-like domain-containing protein n=1 Tax=Tenebrio molitor TaxID=7067 RepID=A0A8J6HBD9_TENMO|nr:hypothetical protein GEV33_011246 [Tenebrio molitor]
MIIRTGHWKTGIKFFKATNQRLKFLIAVGEYLCAERSLKNLQILASFPQSFGAVLELQWEILAELTDDLECKRRASLEVSLQFASFFQYDVYYKVVSCASNPKEKNEDRNEVDAGNWANKMQELCYPPLVNRSRRHHTIERTPTDAYKRSTSRQHLQEISLSQGLSSSNLSPRYTAYFFQFEEEVGGTPRNVRTVEHEEAVLNVFEEDGTRSIRTVSREMGLSKSSVQRVPADNRRHPYHYTGVQHLLPEDYPIRREFYLWLINQNDAPHFLSRILFSDESLFCRILAETFGKFWITNIHSAGSVEEIRSEIRDFLLLFSNRSDFLVTPEDELPGLQIQGREGTCSIARRRSAPSVAARRDEQVACSWPEHEMSGNPRKPNESHLRIFGSTVMVHVPKEKQRKWDKKYLVGYSENIKGYRLYDPESRKIIVARDVVVMKNVSDDSTTYIFIEYKEQPEPEEDSQLDSTNVENNVNDVTNIPSEMTSESEGSLYESSTSVDTTAVAQQDTLNVPEKRISLTEGVIGPEKVEWQCAMKEELKSLNENDTWELVDMPKNGTVVKNKWVFKKKYNSDGENVLEPIATETYTSPEKYAHRGGEGYKSWEPGKKGEVHGCSQCLKFTRVVEEDSSKYHRPKSPSGSTTSLRKVSGPNSLRIKISSGPASPGRPRTHRKVPNLPTS